MLYTTFQRVSWPLPFVPPLLGAIYPWIQKRPEQRSWICLSYFLKSGTLRILIIFSKVYEPSDITPMNQTGPHRTIHISCILTAIQITLKLRVQSQQKWFFDIFINKLQVAATENGCETVSIFGMKIYFTHSIYLSTSLYWCHWASLNGNG